MTDIVPTNLSKAEINSLPITLNAKIMSYLDFVCLELQLDGKIRFDI